MLIAGGSLFAGSNDPHFWHIDAWGRPPICRTPHSTDESIWITGPILDRRFRRIWNIVVQSFARERQTNGVERYEGHPVSMTNTHAAYGIIEDANGVTDAVLAASS
jgi:hypothetical protein